MTISTVNKNGVEIAILASDEVLVNDVQSALDLLATVCYETGCERMVLSKSALCDNFFQLKTRLAGEILQKFTNYRMKLAIVGDFSMYASKSLEDFIYESNKGTSIFFVPTIEQAVEKLSSC